MEWLQGFPLFAVSLIILIAIVCYGMSLLQNSTCSTGGEGESKSDRKDRIIENQQNEIAELRKKKWQLEEECVRLMFKDENWEA